MSVDVKRPRCPYCHQDVVPGEGRGCASCMGWAHEECWEFHGGCPACGAERTAPPTSPDHKADPAAARAANRILIGLLVAVLIGTIATLVGILQAG